ncbi:CHASE2 domain-containing protein [Sulfitobacter sp. M22]|uniref:CHASE2 domain-containing protein n=1 Tax=Sulfitobacter sp. M22 TaxID=2675332 RepID=UPI001F296C48|nr:adenylate/guanylate cyclase domain-containing protein [Sulfitobacter sp. M22]MCF7728072.1 CHASE2 domain-containing protein [Sulfitobacter sp. M22]
MRKLFIGFGLVLLFALVGLRISDPTPVQSLRLVYFDELQKWHPRRLEDLPVRVVDIDERSLAEFGQWPWPRNVLADLVDRLSAGGAAAIVFDVLFLEPDRLSPNRLFLQPSYDGLSEGWDPDTLPDNDRIFAQAIQDRQVILGIASTVNESEGKLPQKSGVVEIGDNPSQGFVRSSGFSIPLPELSDAAKGLGSINMSPYDTTERVRRVPLLWRDANDAVIPSLALEALRVALGQGSFIINGESNASGITRSIRVGSIEIPTTADASLWVRFRPDHPSLYRSAADVFTSSMENLSANFEGRIVLVGTSAAGLLDIRTTALGENVPGVSIHAQIIEQILQGSFLSRTDFVEGVEILVFVVLGGLILWIMSVSGAFLSILTATSIGALIVATSWFLFYKHGILLDVTLPVFGGVLFFSAMTAFQYFVADRDKKMIRRSFSHYVAPEVLHQIEQSGHKLKLGGEMKSVSVMFCDIRNFTALSETMAAPQMVTLLNNIFSALSSEIMRQKGTIDKYIGDSIMAFWNAPVDVDDYPRKSCLAALAMRHAMVDLNLSMDPPPPKDIGIAIGIGMGTACIGNVGSKERFDYSAIGDVVNRAARIEASCRDVGHDILVSEDVMKASEGLAFLEAGQLSFKGVSQRQKIYALVGDDMLCETPMFQKLCALHTSAISAIARGDVEPVDRVEQCETLAQSLNIDLAGFYARLTQRLSDFRD